MKKRPIFIFSTETDTGINTLPIGSLIMVDNYATKGTKVFRKLNNTGLTASTTVAQAVTAKNITKAENSNVVAMTNGTIDMALGSSFTYTCTGSTTFTISNPPPSGVEDGFKLTLTNGAASTVTTYPTGTKWAGGTAPTLSAGVDELAFTTIDGGTTWSGVFIKKDSK